MRQIKRLELDPWAAVQGLAPGTREAVQLLLNPEPRFPYLSDGNNLRDWGAGDSGTGGVWGPDMVPLPVPWFYYFVTPCSLRDFSFLTRD